MKYLTINEILAICKDVSASDRIRSFDPEVILYIKEAGWLIGTTLSQVLNLPLYGIKTSRIGNNTKQRFENFFGYLPWQFSHLLRVIEMKLPIHKTLSKRDIIIDRNFLQLKFDTRILLVDDAIDSGVSFSSVVSFLRGKGYKNILSFVITTTSDKPIYSADISYLKEIITFPWSIGSPEYKKYKEYIKNNV